MRKSLWVGTLAVVAGLGMGCSGDDTAATGTTGGSAGRGGGGASGSTGSAGRGTAGSAGVGGSGGGGAGGAPDASGDANGGGGAGGTAGGMAGSGGTGIVDPCEGKFRTLPVTVSSAFTTLRVCSGGTCTNPPMPYFFSPIPNPNCDEVFPDGGIAPPFPLPDAGSDPDADAGAGPDAGDAAEVSTSPPADASDTGTTADTSAGTGGADGSTDARAGDAPAGDAPSDVPTAPPSCYEFAYNPACTTGTCWGGVIFTQSAGGMADPGVCIEPDATKITFQAKASRPNARIKFGSIREGMGATEFFLNITTEWASYEVTIPPGEPYNSYSAGSLGVWNGFSVIVEPQDHPGGTYIFVKDAVWVK